MTTNIHTVFFFLLTFLGYSQSTIITPGGTTENIRTTGSSSSLVLTGLTTQERNAISNPKEGQLIYNKTIGCLEFFNGFRWNNLCENNFSGSSLGDGLVAYYPFNGNANDESGNKNHGLVNGAVLSTDRFGQIGKSYSFTKNQEIVIPSSSFKNIFPLTVSLWYNVDSISQNNNGNLFSKYVPASWNGYLIHVTDSHADPRPATIPWYIRNPSNRLLGDYGEESFFQSNISYGKWYHFVFTVSQTEGRIYVDGKLVDTHPWTGTPGSSSNGYLWKIGGQYNGWFHGKIDDVGIWNRALSQEEVNLLYENNISPKVSNVTELIEMVNIPGGTFQMGDTRNDGEPDEKPVRTVSVNGFRMGKYEVTKSQWYEIMGNNTGYFDNCVNCPIANISWLNVITFCNKLSDREGRQRVYTINGGNVTADWNANGYRLPTEAEWEYAAGGGAMNRTRFGNGKDILDPSEANFYPQDIYPYSNVGIYRIKTVAVGSFIPNQFGLYDMSGNVMEWCWDWYGTYQSSSESNPRGPSSGSDHVLRGGSWGSPAVNCRVNSRARNTPDYRDSYRGFRVVTQN